MVLFSSRFGEGGGGTGPRGAYWPLLLTFSAMSWSMSFTEFMIWRNCSA
ncbi:hypothetical protein STTU_6254 [Streptomyces sp. Tu6071]|nr:hypothetical protein STTU_6254 [Streptomyces sp. Tu6071]